METELNTLNAYAIKDINSKLFTEPFFLQNDTVAKRTFKEACLNTETKFYKYPQDFSLYLIGNYNIVTANYTTYTPEQIANATEFGSEKITQ